MTIKQEFACGSRRELLRASDSRCRFLSIEISQGDSVLRRHADIAELGFQANTAGLRAGLDALGGERKRETAIHGPVRPAPVVHMTPGWIIRRARDPISAASLGWGTVWCTAFPSRLPIWRSYQSGDLYVIQGQGNRKQRRTRYQIHVGADGRIECARHDNSHYTLSDLIERHAELAPWLQKQRDANMAAARERRRTGE